MAITKAQRDAHDRYFSRAYRQVKLSMPKSEADDLEAFCTERGYTKAGFIRSAVREKMEKERLNTGKLDAAVALVAAATGETTKELITRQLMQNLHRDIDSLAKGFFKMRGGYSKKRIQLLNEAVTDSTGLSADEWILNGEPMSNDARKYVLSTEDPKQKTYIPGEIKTALFDLRGTKRD